MVSRRLMAAALGTAVRMTASLFCLSRLTMLLRRMMTYDFLFYTDLRQCKASIELEACF